MQYRVVLIGDESGLPILENVVQVYSNIEVKLVIVSQKRGKTAFSVGNTIAQKFGCPLLVHPDSYDILYHEFVENIKDTHPNMGIVYSYDRILKQEILDIFQGQIYNIHGSLLPRYRGANVLNWVLINGEKKTGITVHKMVEELDAGEIAVQEEIEINECDTAITLRDKYNMAACSALNIFLEKLFDGTLELYEQNPEEVTVVKRRKPEDGCFSWDQDAKSIYNLIRALVAPYPGAWYIKEGKKYVIDYFVSYEDVVKMQEKMRK